MPLIVFRIVVWLRSARAVAIRWILASPNPDATAAMCSYTVCFPPAVARLTTKDRRTAAFSMTFGAGIGSGALVGLVGGWAPGWLYHARTAQNIAGGMRMVLLLACVLALAGILPLMRLRFPDLSNELPGRSGVVGMKSFLIPFLTTVAVWNIAIAAFAPFTNLYLSGVLRVPLTHIGLIFSASQLLQVLGVSAAPFLYRVLGKGRGIGCLQVAAAACFLVLAHLRHAPLAIAVYLLLMSFQYTCSPGIYSMAMDRTELRLQSSVSAWQNLITCISAAVAAAVAGAVIARSGYSTMLDSAALFALVAAAAFVWQYSNWLQDHLTRTASSGTPLQSAAHE
jgi:predicted MFS family arabinose efflux permease